jgi:hypothetical protein
MERKFLDPLLLNFLSRDQRERSYRGAAANSLIAC